MTSPWIRAQDRKRGLVAWASTACLYALAFLGAWAIGLLAPMTLASVPGTVIVDLGGIEGPPGEVPQGLETAPDRPPGAPPGAAPPPAAGSEPPAAPEAPLSRVAPAASSLPAIPAPAPEAKAPAKPAPAKGARAPAAKAPQPKAAAKTIPAKDAAAAEAVAARDAAAKAAAQVAAQERAAEEDAATRAAAATAQAAAGPPKTRTFGSSSSSKSGAPVASSGTGSAPGVAGGAGTVTFRGSEMGSALTTTFGASTGLVGRNLYEPIWMYMPLPKTIGDAIYRNISAKETFRSFYQQSGSDWKLKAQIPVAQRSDVWNMLDSAGFDASTADFRTERKLSPVVLEFTVGPVSNKKVELVDVRLLSSSGSSEVDEAVIYGFRRGAYFNKTGNAVGGKFVYGF